MPEFEEAEVLRAMTELLAEEYAEKVCVKTAPADPPMANADQVLREYRRLAIQHLRLQQHPARRLIFDLGLMMLEHSFGTPERNLLEEAQAKALTMEAQVQHRESTYKARIREMHMLLRLAYNRNKRGLPDGVAEKIDAIDAALRKEGIVS